MRANAPAICQRPNKLQGNLKNQASYQAIGERALNFPGLAAVENYRRDPDFALRSRP